MELELIKPVIEKIEANLLKQIGQQIGYLIHLNSNIRNLKDQFQKLDEKRRGVQLGIDEAKRNVELIAPEIESWVCKVDNIIPGLQRFLEEDVKANTMCLDGWCPNPKSRYSLSRNAKKKTLEIDGLLRDATAFVTKASYSRPPLGIGSLSIEGIMDFESRTKIRKEVLEALRADKDNIIAICGMGGIGKTTMAKEVAKRAKDDKLFDEVVMAVVSQNQDLRKIQGQIAEMLGLKLVEENSLVRKERLIKRLMDDKSILVILDDVWDVLDLEAVGIPYGGQQKRCKLLLTSRSEEACIQMKAKIFPIKVLTEEEAWSLLRDKAGNCTDTPNLCPIAKEVAKECGGLPVTIITVGRALEDKSKVEWDAALQQLKKSILKNIPGLDSKVYSSMELSYNYLGSNEAKSCLLLCCLFPEDHDIPIEYLVRYGVGQRLFKRIDNVAEARNIVHAIVKNLKRSSLLLDSEKVECVKMHDVVRDFAISKADELGFLMFPTNLFKGMKELKVLSMQGMSFLSLPQSIRVLENLRTLHLDYCKFEDVSAIGALKKLEMLSFFGSRIRELPRETKNLSHLKLLDLSKCFDLQRIPPGLLSSLSRLEELYMGEVLRVRHSKDVEYVIDTTSDQTPQSAFPILESLELSYLVELKEICHGLSKCSSLKNVRSDSQLAFFVNLKSLWLSKCSRLKNVFSLSIARGLVKLQELEIERCDYMEEIFLKEGEEDEMAFDRIKFPQLTSIRISCLPKLIGFCTAGDPAFNISHKLFSSKTILWLLNLENLKLNEANSLRVIFDLGGLKVDHDYQRMAVLAQLKTLGLRSLSKLTEVWNNVPRGVQGFQNLKSIIVNRCHRLSYLFPSSVAKLLVELQSITVDKCDAIENTVQRDGEEDEADISVFHKVTSIDLIGLPSLVSLSAGAYSFAWLSMKKIDMKSCPKLKTFGSEIWSPRKQKKTNRDRSTTKKSQGSTSVNKEGPEGISGFGNLRLLVVWGCNSLTYLFSPSIAKLLVMLEEIQVTKCEKIEEILIRATEEEKEEKNLFHKVNSILLRDLPNLKCFCNEAIAFEWPSLKKMMVIRCPNLRTFVPSNLKTPELEGVYEDIEFKISQWKGDLNATIEHIFKGKGKQRIGKKKGKKWKELGGANQTTAWL
ncbi:probable disease resistance protein At4g27220 [Quercus lobata]|uniref:probable disease resistance protein At4g27220 n=1 Tax=Quercus lobata TaxID=97700 RepID=UPI0012488A29|nr:probable disease resistance protein At4g27220 [Quercus lobata]